jgi:heterodisulfide reductase subunit B2
MDYAYYPGCSLTGTAKKMDKGVRAVFTKIGHNLKDIPDWNCCGAIEYGDRRELTELSRENLEKAKGVSDQIVAPCPACYRNLKEANDPQNFSILNPLELFTHETISSIDAKLDLKGKVFTPYYGCILLRPKETAIKNQYAMEEIITYFGGDIEGEKMRDRCCGGGQIFMNKDNTKKLSTLIVEKTKGTLVVFCPLCQMALKTFSGNRKVIYLTDLLLHVMGERNII